MRSKAVRYRSKAVTIRCRIEPSAAGSGDPAGPAARRYAGPACHAMRAPRPRRLGARSVLARRGHHALHLGVDGEQLAHGRLGARRRRRRRGRRRSGAWWPRDASVGRSQPVTGPPETWRAAETMPERCSSMRLPATWMSSEWNSASAREKVSASPWAMAWPMISTMSASRCWTSSRPCPAARRAASGSIVQRSSLSSRRWSSRCGPKARHSMMSGSSRFQSLTGRTRVPTLGRALTRPLASRTRSDSRTTVRETSKRWPISSGTSGRSAPRSPETIIWPSCWTSWPCSPRPRLPAARRPTRPSSASAPSQDGGADAVGAGRLRVGVAVEFARAGEAGVGGAGGGHHGVRKGTHASFVGARSSSLEVFGEKHTKG